MNGFTLALLLLISLWIALGVLMVRRVNRLRGPLQMRLLLATSSALALLGLAGLLFSFLLTNDAARQRLSAYLITKALQINNRSLEGSGSQSTFVAIGMTEYSVNGERVLYPYAESAKYAIIFEPHQAWSGRLGPTGRIERDPASKIYPTLSWVFLGRDE